MMYFQRGPFPPQIQRPFIEQRAKLGNVQQFRLPIVPIRRLALPRTGIILAPTPSQRLIQAEVKRASENSIFLKGVKIKLDGKRCKSSGVYVFDVLVCEKENSSEFPPVKLQVTDDYPGEIPVLLDFPEIIASITNKRTRLKFELAVQLFKKYLLALNESQCRIPNLIKVWSMALNKVLNIPQRVFKPKPAKK